ncbi:MAG: hypothetical protein SGJ00_02660 [bacterium]|nr:hypothetical protein [bacterium]
MKKTIYIILLSAFTSAGQAQGLKDRFFQQTGFSIYTDIYYSPIQEKTFTTTVDDKNYNPTEISLTGEYRSGDYALVSFYYTPIFNLIEKGSEKSFSINMPIGLHLTKGLQSFGANYNVPGTNPAIVANFNYNRSYLGSLSFPIYFTYNAGMGSTLLSEKELGFSIGLGLDNRLVGLSETTGNNSLSPSLPKISTMPSLMLGFRHWRNDKAKELKIKLSYMPSTYSGSNASTVFLLGDGFAFALTFNRFLNF